MTFKSLYQPFAQFIAFVHNTWWSIQTHINYFHHFWFYKANLKATCDRTLNEMVAFLHQHLSMYIGHYNTKYSTLKIYVGQKQVYFLEMHVSSLDEITDTFDWRSNDFGPNGFGPYEIYMSTKPTDSDSNSSRLFKPPPQILRCQN